MPSCFSPFGKWLKRGHQTREISGEESREAPTSGPALSSGTDCNGKENHSAPAITIRSENLTDSIITEDERPPPPYQASLPAAVHHGERPRADLVGRGAGSDKKCCLGTLLLQAIRGDHVKIALELLRRGADPNVKDPYGYALTEAIRGDHVELALELLQRGADLNVTDSYGYALMQAKGSGSKRLEKALLDRISDPSS